ncbi:MAG: hypothetical protein K6G12_00775 [Lachnospiraceae bacterium]|nr:hypothetical protein [Lachnospiraceae bacterium]
MGLWNSFKKKISGFSDDWDDLDDWNEWDAQAAEEDGDYGDGDESDALGPKGRDWERVIYSREHINIHDHKERHDYVVNCLEQIAEATRELENLEFEYNMVTAYLKDMEEIENLAPEDKVELERAAAKVSAIRREREKEDQKEPKYMPDAKFAQLMMLDSEVEEGIKKLSDAEDYQKKIKSDLKKLDNERSAFRYRRSELISEMEDCKGMGVVCTVAACVCILALLIMQFVFEMNTSAGYVLAAGGAALFYIFVFLKYREASSEFRKLSSETNRLILLQNKVKIRYVNNHNLLDYLCLKYKVSSSKELNKLWKQFNEEKERRAAIRKSQLELDLCENELTHILRRYQIGDTAIWLNQTDAILDHKEMVEIRHSLIVRRQSLRKRMDYNREVVAANAQNEIKDLVESYPKYSSEIMALVEEYDAREGAGAS